MSYTTGSTSASSYAISGVANAAYINTQPLTAGGLYNPTTTTNITYPYTISTYPTYPTYTADIYQDAGMYPFAGKALSEQDRIFVTNFKTRHPDFDTYSSEITLILARKPGLTNTVLFMPLLYELARELRATIDKIFNDEAVEKVVDGQTP